MINILIFTMTSLVYLSYSYPFTLLTQNPNQTGWADSEIKFLINSSNCPSSINVPDLIKEAAQVWNNVANSSVTVTIAGETTSTTFANPVTVYCETNFQTVTTADQDSVPGAASANPTGHTLTSGLLYLNVSSGNANIENFDYETLKVILAHEIGHVLGLGHSTDKNALMYFDASAKKTLRLGQDDIDGMSYLYPSNELGDGQFAGCGLIQTQKPPRFLNILVILLLLIFPLALVINFRNSKAGLKKI